MITYRDIVSLVNNISVNTGSIGRSVQGRQLHYVKIGQGSNNIIVQAAIHAREYATSDIVVMWILDYINIVNNQILTNINRYNGLLKKYIHYIQTLYIGNIGNNTSTDTCRYNSYEIDAYSIKKIFGKYSFWFLPCVNPDGVALSQSESGYTMYKANANRVDLNTNFDARWGSGVSNKTIPSDSDYIGGSPNDQIETQNLINFSKRLSPVSTISVHSRGREIYWDFWQDKERIKRDLQIATLLGCYTGYSVKSSQQTSSGGYKDWCIEKLKIPAFTLECFESDIQYPIDINTIMQEYYRLRFVPIVLAQALE